MGKLRSALNHNTDLEKVEIIDMKVAVSEVNCALSHSFVICTKVLENGCLGHEKSYNVIDFVL